MKKTKRAGLRKRGYVISNTQEFLSLSDEETALIDLKIQLVQKLRTVRTKAGITQKELAKLLQTSQSRIAMLEACSPDVSLDMLCKALFCLGVTARQIGKTIASKHAA